MPSAAPPVADRPPSPWYRYRQHFEHNQTRPLPQMPATLDPGGPDGIAEAFARMLARFQLGETGEGRVVREIQQVHLTGVDADYRRALELFVKEEGRHARILAAMVRGLGGRLLSRAGSHRLFRWCRRLLGVRFKLLVLLVAEVVGGELYATLAREARWPAVLAALNQMVEDEDDHLVFHVEFLRSQARTSLARLAGRCALWIVGAGALSVVLLENRRDLRILGLDRRALVSRIVATLRLANGAAFGGKQRLHVSAAQAVRS